MVLRKSGKGKPAKKGKLSSKRKGSSFIYKERDPSSVKARAEQTGGRFDSPIKPGVETYRMEQGENTFRILPPTWDDHEHYGYDVYIHRNVGVDNSSYVCLNKMQGKRCPICDLYKELKDDGEEDDAKAIAPTKRVYMWVLDRDADDNTPRVMDMSWTMDRDIAALCTNKKSGKTLLIDHPDQGYDITVRRQGTGLKTKYFGIAIDRDPSPISEDPDVQEEILEYIQANPIPDILQIYDAKHLEKVLSGTSEQPDEDLDDDEEDEDVKKPSKKSPKARKRRDPEDDEEDEEDEEEDEEEDDEDEPDEEEDEEEEEEDEEEDDESEDEEDEGSDDDDEEEEEDEPNEEEEEEDEEEDDDEDERPSRKRGTKRAKPKTRAPARRAGVTRKKKGRK